MSSPNPPHPEPGDRRPGRDPDHDHAHDTDHQHGRDHDHAHAHADEHSHHARAHAHGHDHDHDHHHAHDDEHEHDRDHAHEHHHGDDHDHHHGDEHEHEGHRHPHAHGGYGASNPNAQWEPRALLERGAGEHKLLFLDAPSGLAGDMIVAALVDLGVPFSEVIAAIDGLGLQGFSIEIRRGFAGAIGASRFDVSVDRAQPERSYSEIDGILAGADLRPRTSGLARAIFRRLAEAEAEVHRVDVASVHFHEVGAVDAIVDIVAAAACFDYLGADVVASPLPLGRGRVKCRHGVIPLPAPASVLCLRGVPTYDAGIEAELVTPTGAAILATVATGFTGWPSFAPEHVGWGMGVQVLPDRPNALRAVLGEPWQALTQAGAATHVVVEANIDDLTGELAGHALSALMQAGALDAWLTPIQMKKGRPGLTLSALCPINAADRIGAVLLRETTSIGYRKSPVTRGERPRRSLVVATDYGDIPIKVSSGPWGAPQIKPEFDACAERASELGVAVKDVVAAALAAARSELGSADDA